MTTIAEAMNPARPAGGLYDLRERTIPLAGLRRECGAFRWPPSPPCSSATAPRRRWVTMSG